MVSIAFLLKKKSRKAALFVKKKGLRGMIDSSIGTKKAAGSRFFYSVHMK